MKENQQTTVLERQVMGERKEYIWRNGFKKEIALVCMN